LSGGSGALPDRAAGRRDRRGRRARRSAPRRRARPSRAGDVGRSARRRKRATGSLGRGYRARPPLTGGRLGAGCRRCFTRAGSTRRPRYVGSMPPGRNDPCPCGSGLKYKRCCRDADRARDRLPSATAAAWSGQRAGPADESNVTLIVETPAGVLVRRVPNAMPLQTDIDRGEAAEEAVHDAAAIWGLPDFIYRGRVVGVGSGAREIGDNLLVVGSVGVVVQVKSRVASGGDAERERRWIEKNTQTALDQARGSIRRLRLGPVEITNARGRTIKLDGSKLRLAVRGRDRPPKPTLRRIRAAV
jgi:hypothetical protein